MDDGARTTIRTPELLILACSRRAPGRCVAGVDLATGEWVRPVTADDDGGLGPTVPVTGGDPYLTPVGITVRDWPKVGDVCSVPLAHPQPKPWQPENHVMADEEWRLVRHADPQELLSRVEAIKQTASEIFGGWTRKISADACRRAPVEASLTVVEPDNPEWVVEEKTYAYRRSRSVDVRFRLGDNPYKLDLTDPSWESRTRHLELGEHPFDAASGRVGERVFLVISLGAPFNGDCYKLVAGVIAI